MEEDIVGDMTEDGLLEGGTPDEKGCSEGLQPVEDPRGRKDTPKGTVACEGPVPGQQNSKKQGMTERNYCALTIVPLNGLEGTGYKIW